MRVNSLFSPLASALAVPLVAMAGCVAPACPRPASPAAALECGVHNGPCCETGGPKPYACLPGLRCFGTLPDWSCLFPGEGECGVHGAPCCETGGPKPYACLSGLQCFGTRPDWSCLRPEEGPP